MSPKRLAIYPGTFDPITNGHLDILSRATALFDHVTIAVAKESTKTAIFSIEERVDLIKRAIKTMKFQCPVSVESFTGLLVNFAKQKKARTLVRGLRAVSDFEYEFQFALMNRHQASSIETLFLMPDEKYVYLSSSIVKQISRLRGDLTAFLPKPVIQALERKRNS
jgi:pantetheine-phosphate adenylyltransferase